MGLIQLAVRGVDRRAFFVDDLLLERFEEDHKNQVLVSPHDQKTCKRCEVFDVLGGDRAGQAHRGGCDLTIRPVHAVRQMKSAE